MKPWYEINNIDDIDTPALVIYPDRVSENIRLLKTMLPEVDRLRPHIKTNKSPEVTSLLLEAGIRKFKCATIAEAEMLASQGAPDVLLAYQPVGPKAIRLIHLMRKYPATQFSCLVDSVDVGRSLSSLANHENLQIAVFIDVNVGMNRTGIPVGEVEGLFASLTTLPGIKLKGLHVYDGHIRDKDLSDRIIHCDKAFAPIPGIRKKLEAQFGPMTVVAGGTPTFPCHARRPDVECSPGTFVFWDYGYDHLLEDEPFVFAALVITRVISHPEADTVCIDLGHKSIASENPLPNRVHFLNAPELTPTGHSEEHMTLTLHEDSKLAVGDVLYGVPYHVCPTCALFDTAWIVENGIAEKQWSISARKRTISI